MAEMPTALTQVPRNLVPVGRDSAPSRGPRAEEVELVVDGASRLAEILRRSAMRRISVSMEGVRWDIEAPAEPAAPGAIAPARPAAPGPAGPAETMATGPAGPAGPLGAPGQPLTAPLVGVFYRSRSPGAVPLVEVGSRVEAGQPVAIVEAMKLMNEIVAVRSGLITAVHAEDGEVVEYGQRLFTVDAA